MGRWLPDAQRRLLEAAMDLFSERGYEETTVAEIAQRAGLTERTFFRHFADKREVLFRGSDALTSTMVEALDRAAPSLSPVQAVGVAAERGLALLTDRRAFAQRRNAIIAANPELQERERIKLASLSSALSDALQRRGVRESAAILAGEMSVAVFKVAFEAWIADPEERDPSHYVREAMRDLTQLFS